ncbi:hypothetical protein NQ317_001460, partial [Molorchus minor]
VLGSKKEYHFVNHALPVARTKRSIPHMRKLKVDPLNDRRGDKTLEIKQTHNVLCTVMYNVYASIIFFQVHSAIQQPGFLRVKRGYKPLKVENLVKDIRPHRDPTDPYFPFQWYLKNTGQNGGKAKLDLNVEAAWAQGVTGKNVTTAIMDDGVDYMHPDLKYNYNAEASYDFSSNDPFPYPRYTDDWFNSHGNEMRRDVAAARDNGICGVGVAYDSKIAGVGSSEGSRTLLMTVQTVVLLEALPRVLLYMDSGPSGIRMLDQPYMTDLIEANSMGHEPNLIHIYSASWGPTDDGKTVDGPRNATMRAIVRGVNEGRNGLGNIYVWASGDGGEDDDCNCDGYAASMWTISINSAINDGQNAHYDESCSSTLASTFSNGAKDPNTGVSKLRLFRTRGTYYVDAYRQQLIYTENARRPIQAHQQLPLKQREFLLWLLEANSNLSWRDIQHLTVLTSKRNSLFDAKGRFHWTMNGVGLEFNHLFGFGVLDAGAMVALAKQWKTVPPRFHCEAGTHEEIRKIPSDQSLYLKITTNACHGDNTEVRYLEHVQAVLTLNASRRGDVELFLTSPMGTRSMILSRRQNDDDSRDGFSKWPFMTTHTWGEYPQGTWLLEAKFSSQIPQTGFVKEWTLMLHGTKEPPYTELPVLDPHSKLAIVKKAHESRSKM